MFHKTKNKNKKYFCKCKIRIRKIEFKNYFKHIPTPFKIYTDSESNLEGVEIYEGFYSKK